MADLRLISSHYEQAKQSLQGILSHSEFQNKGPSDPWWARVAEWIASHLHLSLSRTSWQTVGWSLGILALLCVVVLGAWWIRSLRRSEAVRVPLPSVRADSPDDAVEQATRAYRHGDYVAMVEALVDGYLRCAAARGWAELLPHKTLRAYKRELDHSAEANFAEKFGHLAADAEQVLFNRRDLPEGEALQLLTDARRLLTGGGA
jgi:hypothetical protein